MWFYCTETWANLLYNSSNRCFSWLNRWFFFISPAFNLDFYTDVLDLNYLLEHIKDDPFTQKYKKLNEALVGLVEDYGLVSFKTLDVQVSVGSCQNVDGKAGRINEYFSRLLVNLVPRVLVALVSGQVKSKKGQIWLAVEKCFHLVRLVFGIGPCESSPRKKLFAIVEFPAPKTIERCINVLSKCCNCHSVWYDFYTERLSRISKSGLTLYV